MPQHQEPPLSPQTIRWLQTTSGNRAVQRLLARRRAMQRHSEQQLMVVSVEEPQELELTPASLALVVVEDRTWWQRILQWLYRKRAR